MTALLGYCDPISAAPGERVRFFVSCIGAARYQAEIVRLINPQAGPLATPFRTEPVDCAANRSYPGRRQPIHIGSFGVVDEHPAFGALSSFTLQAYVWPTTPGRSRQALLGTWSESGRRGIGLGGRRQEALLAHVPPEHARRPAVRVRVMHRRLRAVVTERQSVRLREAERVTQRGSDLPLVLRVR